MRRGGIVKKQKQKNWAIIPIYDKEIIVRRATPDDAKFLVELNYEFNGVQSQEEEVKDCLNRSNELVVIGIREGKPVAFACAQYYKSFCYQNLCGEITEIYVREEVRRIGIASLMLSLIEAELQARGVTSLNIITGLCNEAAIKTYEKSNYIKKDYQVLNKKNFK